MIGVLLAVDDLGVATEFADLAAESGAVTVLRTVPNAGELITALDMPDVDVIVLHADLGPLPVMELAREVAARAPDRGLVLLTEDSSAELLAAALRAGFRGIARLPLSLEDLRTAVEGAGAWTQSLRSRLAETAEEGVSGTMVAVAGAKGGVGTTTIAVQLALQAVRATPGRSVCLVDFDLQAGDVRSYLDLTHRRSVADLVEVAREITSRQLDESLYGHPNGLRILLPPPDGEHAEDVDADVARRILAAIRTRFDVVVVDVGAVVTEGGSVATELADRVALVTTPDVPSMRAANRLLALWERLRIRKDHVHVVVNRASRDSEIQPDLVAKVVAAPVLRAVIPSDFRALEAAANTGVADRLEEGGVHKGIAALAHEFGLVPRAAPRSRLPFRSGSDGQAAGETLGMTLLIGLSALLLWELFLAGFTMVLGNHAAREAARELAVSTLSGDALADALLEVAREDLPAAWAGGVELEVHGEDRVRLSLPVPLLVPSLHGPLRIPAEEGTIREGGGP